MNIRGQDMTQKTDFKMFYLILLFLFFSGNDDDNQNDLSVLQLKL